MTLQTLEVNHSTNNTNHNTKLGQPLSDAELRILDVQEW